MKRIKLILLIAFIALAACRVTFITGYDQILDETITQIKKDFNLHFIKLARTIQDNDPNNQQFTNFQDYYDKLEADLITIGDRTKFLGGKSQIVQQQVRNVDSAFHQFMTMHKNGLPDRPNDDRRDIRNAINSALDAVTILQESLKTTGSPN